MLQSMGSQRVGHDLGTEQQHGPPLSGIVQDLSFRDGLFFTQQCSHGSPLLQPVTEPLPSKAESQPTDEQTTFRLSVRLWTHSQPGTALSFKSVYLLGWAGS